MPHPPPSRYAFGPFCLDLAKSQLLKDGKPVALRPKEFDLLVVLVSNCEQTLSKDDLLQRVWPDAFVEENNLSVNISTLRKTLGEGGSETDYIETVPKRGYRFSAQVKFLPSELPPTELLGPFSSDVKSPTGSGSPANLTPETSRGALATDSPYYIERSVDAEFQEAIRRGTGIVLVKGARQMGKSSLLARGLRQARAHGVQAILTDLQALNEAQFESPTAFYLALGGLIADQLDMDVLPGETWNHERGPSLNFSRYLQREILPRLSTHLVWELDEMDRLFLCQFRNEVFALFRSWHNSRSFDPDSPWKNLTIVISYATEAHLFITDINQSPFNVGVRLLLRDFTPEQVQALNLRFDSPLKTPVERERFFQLLGGHPYLTHYCLRHLATHPMSLEAFEKRLDTEEGPLGDHLRHLLGLLMQDQQLVEGIGEILRGHKCPTTICFYRLRSAGLISGDSALTAKIRCRTYATYLAKHLG